MEHQIQIDRRDSLVATGGRHKLAFAGLFLFTFLLYARPNEALPGVFGDFPIVKIVAIACLLAYLLSKISSGERLTIWPTELKMVLLIALLGFASIPLSAAPQDGMKVMTDVFLKVVAIFILMINLIDTRERLQKMMKLVVIAGSVLAIFAIGNYLAGKFVVTDKQVGIRIAGVVGGIFGNPNDLAISLALLVPLALGLALMSRGTSRLFYLICSGLLSLGVILTFSRGGFLGLAAMGLVLLKRFGRQHRAATALAVVFVVLFFTVAMPVGYSERISSIFEGGNDPTGSIRARRELLQRATYLAVSHPVIGLGIGNFHIYSIREQRAHNSYLEISAELGVLGLIAYLIMLFSPLRRLRAIQREYQPDRDRSGADRDRSGADRDRSGADRDRSGADRHRSGADRDRPAAAHRRQEVTGGSRTEMYYLSGAVYACLVGYVVCSFFGSLQYLWFVYYPLAYAVAIRRIHLAEQKSTVPLAEAPQTSGLLWQQYQTRPALEQPAQSGS
jgi:O-antigen ligase